MSEKGDLPQDTDSLPPNYASSEVFTDSPPPAYRKTSTVRLQVTRVVCFTILAAGFLAGVFILTHTYITNKTACNCDKAAPNSPFQDARYAGASSLPQVESLVGSAPSQEEEENINEIDSEPSDLDQESRQMDIPLDEEVIIEESPVDLAEQMLEEEEEEERQQLEDIVQEVQNNAKFPLDLLMGNPQLAGKDVQCKVEKKMQNLGAGILSKTIIVTCDDENDEAEVIKTPFGGMLTARPVPAPPMSLLAPILKMMAARASARFQKQIQPNASFRNSRRPFIQPLGMAVIGGSMRQPRMPGPFPFNSQTLFQGPIRFDGPAPFDGPIPFDVPKPFPENSRINSLPLSREIPSGPFPRPFPPQGNSIVEPQMHRGPFVPKIQEQPQPFISKPHQAPFPGRLIPFDQNRDAPFREDFVENRPPLPEPAPKPFITMTPAKHELPPQIAALKNAGPIKVIHGLPSEMPDALKQIVSHIMNRGNQNAGPGQSIIKIKAVSDDENIPQKSKMLLPFPIRTVKLQGRGARKLSSGEEGNQLPIFPFPRGEMSTGIRPHVVPEAAGRALESPVALPTLSELSPMRFFPGKLLRIPVPIQGRAITHMEMKQTPNDINEDDKPEIIIGKVQEQPNVPEVIREEGPDFGPPRLHTVIRTPVEDNTDEEPNPLPSFLRRVPAPPPQFAREGRVGIIREIESDAELVKPIVAEAQAHRMIMVN